MDNRYDAIVIGSGIGGLTTASLLSQINKKKVLILEKHFAAGGQTHVFKRKNFTWDVGLHYVGEVKEGQISRSVFDFISGNKLKWNSLPNKYSKIVFPDFTFEISENEKEYKKDLIKKFPNDKKSIIKYFKDIKRAATWNQRYFLSQLFPFYISIILKFINLFSRRIALKTTEEYMNKTIKNEKLRSLLQSHWFTYLLPPKESAFVMHAIIAVHFIRGASYPEGGSENIVKTILPQIEKNQGKLLLNREVFEIIIKNNRAIGVKVKHKDIIEEYYAPVIISNVGGINTFKKFLPEKINNPIKEKINTLERGYSNLTLYLGLKDNPRKLGFNGEKYFFFDEYNHNEIFKKSYKLLDGKPNHFIISFSSLFNKDTKKYTAQILYYLDYEHFNKWKDQKWLKRSKEYYKLKDKISDYLIDYIDSKIKGFKNIIEYKELSTPLSYEHFTNRDFGVYYGIPSNPERFRQKWLRVKTPIKNLFLTGSDVCVLGIVGALMGGVATASYLNGFLGIIKVFYKCISGSTKKVKP